MAGAVYGLQKDHQWTEVKLPTDEYVSTIKKMSGVSELKSGNGHDTPVKWLSGGELVIESGSKDIYYDDTGFEKVYDVTIRVGDKDGDPLPLARVVSIDLKPR